MAITSTGYDGSVNETQWAKLVPWVGSAHYGVGTVSSWKVTAHPTMDRGVNIATGTGWGHGVLDTNDATVSLQGAPVGSGSRWDMVVARRNWSGTGGTTSFVIIGGSSVQALPARNTTPGTLDDQPLALVQFTSGQTAPTAIIDLRCWAANGGSFAKDTLALGYLSSIGAVVQIGSSMWAYRLGANDVPEWAQIDLPTSTSYQPLQTTGYSTYGEIVVEPVSGGRKRVTVDLTITRTGGNLTNYVKNGSWTTIASPIPSAGRGSSSTKYLPATLIGGGNNIMIDVYVNPGNGAVAIRAASADHSLMSGALFSVNCVYYI